MKRILHLILLLLCSHLLQAQIPVDLNRSVPLWLDYDTSSYAATLKWIGDDNVDMYELLEITYNPTTTTALDVIDGSATEYALGTLTPGETYGYLIDKDFSGQGVITMGLQIPAVHQRGRCLIAIDDTLALPLALEIDQLINDIQMDGWEVDTLNIPRTTGVVAVKSMVVDWYDDSYQNSQALFILGHVAVPYSGNNAHDGHTNHQGAWAADLFYGEVDGTWTDVSINNTTPSREANKNIPGDGKYDQTLIPSDIEIEVGRVDFYDLPAFPVDEIELTRQYLNKNHEFKIGDKAYPRRALVENNFGSFDEGFGQSGWRNFTTMFTGDSVSIQNYETVLVDEKYLCSYACGSGSYTSCGGVGTTNNLWVAKDIQTVFTMTFGSYFGDWDSQNNFLRAALGSGDVLTNAWAGRPVWQIYDMALGKHIGYSAKATQNAPSFIFNQGFSSRSAHIALMGDPTLRLHAMKRASDLSASFEDGNVNLNWEASPDATYGYMIYRKAADEAWELIADFHPNNMYSDECVEGNTDYEYMVKAIRLELTGSGTYYNTSLGITTTITVTENPFIAAYFADTDMDGFGDPNAMLMACALPAGYVQNDLDCDDTNMAINPEANEIPYNGIDEDCDGNDFLASTNDLADWGISIFPNPVSDHLFIENDYLEGLTYQILNTQGQVLRTGELDESIDISSFAQGLYLIEITTSNLAQPLLGKIMVVH